MKKGLYITGKERIRPPVSGTNSSIPGFLSGMHERASCLVHGFFLLWAAKNGSFHQINFKSPGGVDLDPVYPVTLFILSYSEEDEPGI